ncbi:hypothetical protein AW878_17060 [Bordetella pseudohinzii]|uniref:Lipoprotein n=2 Tax=Bordetella pseudohinzii TaxID=1331258 RepID=A0ABN4RXX2_9BORD|nr:hypothetical protein BBN53_13120 [Bordetella pseudohinzii]KMM25508.1 Hyp domain-containing protein 1 [Bordetella pseudohinzii]KXA76808.1 hypothetical protein AW878_17060 [Bordetella pseudohinzii]KXA77007.1 hypothetical protein AW877_15345 [Bordetella pseudohinzii]
MKYRHCSPVSETDMHFRLALPLCLLALLTACGVSSEIKRVDKDRYEIRYNAGAKAMTWVEIKNQARKQAEDYCAGMNQRYVRPEVSSNHATGLMPKEARVTFSCEDKPAPSPAKDN